MAERTEKPAVLVVDDDASIRNVVSKLLETEGYVVRKAANGQEALESLRKERADVVLLDIKMPKMDGMEVLRRIREGGVETRVILLTAHGTLRTARAAMKLGAVDYITKPFDNEFVKSVVRDALAEREAAGR